MSKQFANVEWGKKNSKPANYLIEDNWMLSYEYTSPTNGTFLFKAGNKDYTLDGSTQNRNGRRTVSEAMLKKKYS